MFGDKVFQYPVVFKAVNAMFILKILTWAINLIIKKYNQEFNCVRYYDGENENNLFY